MWTDQTVYTQNGLLAQKFKTGDNISTLNLIALMMEAARTSETSVNFYQTTRRYNPEDSHLLRNRMNYGSTTELFSVLRTIRTPREHYRHRERATIA
jgi:hypothetical protein